MRRPLRIAYSRVNSTQGGNMTTTSQLESARGAWDRIAAGYDQFVAPTEVWLANEALE